MKRNKSLANIGGTVAVLAITAFGSTSAQTAPSNFKKGSPELAVRADSPSQENGNRVSKRLEQLQQRLNLTAGQLAKIQTIIQTAREKAKSAREQAGSDGESFKKAMQENVKNTDAQIQGVLTAEQAQKYAELKAEMKAKRENEKDND